ncbi:MAG: transposase family protein [Phycisphaerales bacterium]|nr:transposase family protein [Phycisphaerales bacterium]
MSTGAYTALEPNQEQAIVALLTEPTFKKAAAVVGVAEKTIHRWLEDPVFGAAYRKARRQAFNQAIAATQRYVPVAIQALTKITVDESAPHSARVSAASAILKFSRDSIELDDLAERIGHLEAQLNDRAGPPGSERAA